MLCAQTRKTTTRPSRHLDLLVLPACQLPHQEHATSLAALALRPRRIADSRLGAWEPGGPWAWPVVHLRRARGQLTRRTEAASGQLSHERRVRAADARELPRERRAAGHLGHDAA